MVRNALQSIKDQTYKNWQLAFIDDNSKSPGQDVVREMFSEEEYAKTKFYKSEKPFEEKKRTGSDHGHYMNVAITDAKDCEVVIILCDDDALYPDYLEKLAAFYETNPAIMYSYCQIKLINPLTEELSYDLNRFKSPDKVFTEPINPTCKIDSTQVTYRRKCLIEGGCKYSTAKTSAQDAHMYGQLAGKYGLCVCNGIIGQLKGAFPGNMSNIGASSAMHNPVDIS